MPKPVCIPCQRFFRPLETATYILETKPTHPDAKSGIDEPGRWAPYKLWQADLWSCRGCGTTIAVGFGHRPVWEDYRGPLPAGYRHHIVNDC